jgi:DNA-binding XRE family transcriptional regulator
VNKEHNAIDKHVGSRVRMRRLMLDLTQMQLAEGLGLTFQQVQKYEKGTNRISAKPPSPIVAHPSCTGAVFL